MGMSEEVKASVVIAAANLTALSWHPTRAIFQSDQELVAKFRSLAKAMIKALPPELRKND